MISTFVLLFCSLLSLPAWAEPATYPSPQLTVEDANNLQIRIFRYDDILPVGGQLICWQGKNVGHLLHRVSEQEVSIQFLLNGKTDPSRKTKMAAIERSNPFQDYLRSIERFGDVGYSFEVILEKRLNSATDSYAGAVMLTEIEFFRDIAGEEQRKLKPMFLKNVSCLIPEVSAASVNFSTLEQPSPLQ